MIKSKFENIAGYAKEKNELIDLAHILKNYKEIKDMGGRIPRGLLLMGSNGVGKTCLAKSFIKESGMNCVEVDPSKKEKEFDRHIKEVFKDAKTKRPCIIYIEELDKIAGRRDMFSFGDDNYKRFESLLSIINKNSHIDDLFILATANRERRFDNSLIRSGRIDKVINIDLPNEKDRAEIFKYYISSKRREEKININLLAKTTSQFSGADIESVVNEAVLNAIKHNRTAINQKDINAAINDKKFGTLEKESELSKDYQRIVATHEAGHALMMLFGPHNRINRVTILPRGGIKGYAEEESSDDKILSLKEKENLVAVALGGMAAEKVFYNNNFNGSTSDILKAKHFISLLICIDGYRGYDKLVDITGERPPLISEQKLRIIEEESAKIFQEQLDYSINLISKHKKLALMLIDELISKKTIEKDRLEEIFKSYLNTLSNEERLKVRQENEQKFQIQFNNEEIINA